MSSKRFLPLLAVACSSLMVFSAVPSVSADEVDQLISQMDEVSRQANANNEQVKQLEEELHNAEQELQHLRGDADAASRDAAAADQALVTHRREVNKLAEAKYRGSVVDTLTTAMNGETPQNAIDRAAYMSTLTTKASQALKDMSSAAEEARSKHDAATEAVDEATEKQKELQAKHEELLREQAELQAETDDLANRVDALTAAERDRWVNKNSPVKVDVAALSSSVASAVANAALSKVGAPYEWGAAGPDSFDCSGLMLWAYAQNGQSIPRTSQAQMSGGTPVSIDELQPGDIIGYYEGATHVGMYVGDGNIVHASDYGIPVQVVPVDSMPIYGARRY